MEPVVDFQTGDITFDNGVIDNVYEGSDPIKLELGGTVYWLVHGHEEIVIWDITGKRLFETWTR